jgi:MoaA/NifB/PqqE/SkfB family radical SAM enzyme
LYHGNVFVLESIIEECRGLGVRDFLVNSFVPVGRGVNFADRIPVKDDFVLFAELVNKHAPKGLTFKVSSRLIAHLKPCLSNYHDYRFVPFQEEKRGPIIAITADGKLGSSSLSNKVYSFKHEKQIATIYCQKIVF